MFVCELLLLTNLTAAAGSHRGAAMLPFCTLYSLPLAHIIRLHSESFNLNHMTHDAIAEC